MSEAMTETPTTPTEGSTSSEPAGTSLLTGTEAPATTTEQQAANLLIGDEKPAGGEGEKPAESKPPEGAPESYDFKAPEGKTYDSAVLEPFAAAAKEANLTQDAAQKLLDKMAPALAERQTAQVTAIQDGWLAASVADKEFGGEKLKENLAVAKKGMEAYATPELRTLLKETRFENHPEIVRLFYKVGQSVKEDTFVNGSPKTGQTRDIGAILYDNTVKGAN